MIHVINWFVKILTFGLVSIATITTTTYHVDEPISQLNDLSLTQVFETNIQPDLVNTWFANPTTMTLATTGLNTTVIYNALPSISLYVNVNANSNRFNFAQSNALTNGSPIFNYQAQTGQTSYIYNAQNYNHIIIQIANFHNSNPAFFNLTAINLTSLGIDNLTKQELDDWYDIYQQANENEGVYIAATSHLNNNIKLVDVSVMVISFAFWLWLYKFLKGVVL